MKFSFLKHSTIATGFLLISLNVLAQEHAKVISSTPVYQTVNVTQQVCSSTPMSVPQPKSGAGAVMGAIAGGAIGNSMGHGSGNAAATAIGVMGGAILGDRIEGQPTVVQNVQTCTPVTSQQNKLAYFDVKYEFAGKQYSVQMPNDPGPFINVSISPQIDTQLVPSPAVISPPPAVVYVAPTYPAPGVGWIWEFHPRFGWGWRHPGYGWHRGWR